MIIGQNIAINYLDKIIGEDKIGASFLFFGPEGVGKKATARWFAKKINCLSGDNEKKPCNNCSSCNKIEKQSHPDITHIKPEGNYIKIEQTRSILETIVFRPFEAKYRVYIIEDAHTVTDAACNQLLKILEEPPPYAVIILTIHDISTLPPTVISRCRRVPFHYIDAELLRMHIGNNFDLSKEKLASVGMLASGSLGRAVKLIQDEDFWSTRSFSLSLAANIADMNCASALQSSEKLETMKAGQDMVLEFLLEWFRDLMIVKETGNTDIIINQDMKDSLKNNVNDYTVWQIKKMIRHILEAKQMLKRNVNKKVVFNNLFLKLIRKDYAD